MAHYAYLLIELQRPYGDHGRRQLFNNRRGRKENKYAVRSLGFGGVGLPHAGHGCGEGIVAVTAVNDENRPVCPTCRNLLTLC